MKVSNLNTILVNREAYLYLRRESRKQRGCNPLSPEGEDRAWNRVSKIDGLVRLNDDSLGGGDGTYYGRWTAWSVEDLKRMLEDAGFTYQDGEPMEVISV